MPRAARDLHPELRWNLPASRERVSFESARIENLEREAARPLRAGSTRELEDSLVPRPHRKCAGPAGSSPAHPSRREGGDSTRLEVEWGTGRDLPKCSSASHLSKAR